VQSKRAKRKNKKSLQKLIFLHTFEKVQSGTKKKVYKKFAKVNFFAYLCKSCSLKMKLQFCNVLFNNFGLIQWAFGTK
jgi:hypothetical protein